MLTILLTDESFDIYVTLKIPCSKNEAPNNFLPHLDVSVDAYFKDKEKIPDIDAQESQATQDVQNKRIFSTSMPGVEKFRVYTRNTTIHILWKVHYHLGM